MQAAARENLADAKVVVGVGSFFTALAPAQPGSLPPSSRRDSDHGESAELLSYEGGDFHEGTFYGMTTKPIELEHGERYGKLTVLKKIKTKRGIRYRCGCTCGNSDTIVRAAQLMKGSVTACLKCSSMNVANTHAQPQ